MGGSKVAGALLAAAIACVGAAAAESWKTVKGPALKSLFAGKELGDGTHYTFRFREDGTFSGSEMRRDVHGTWRVTDQQMCWKWIRPPGSEECYRVQTSGGEVRLLKGKEEAWYGTLKR